ncbi:sugar ABC transporter permease [Glycomyces sp. TRM65418]|uniref:carbohydrate ABC transporter permease n=1 Tax=Glycomyces sp. TRM65418 TaxID=2867006 RepID=UPI001CE6831D|nr:sugar ABC transporter permease [Glycomyces sp. TRM65418]MCC3764707.1 sugar ABC transporter permease [Glycomyces sp. TRM65418]QZD54366.1 sugar ABC transporter permease [Glycomyces sp. TRM65418]
MPAARAARAATATAVRPDPDSGPGPSKPHRRKPLTLSRREDLHGRVLVSPTVLVVLLFAVLPFLAVVLFAFLDVRLVDIPRLYIDNLEFTGDNVTGVWNSPRFWSAAWTTVVYAAASSAGAVLVGLAVALALRRPFPGRGIIRALVLIPYVLPVVAATTIWKTLLNPGYGLVNAVGVEWLGWAEPIAFLTTTSRDVGPFEVPVALLCVIAFEVWKTSPLAFLFITARLQVAPDDIEEAAEIDGAGKVRVFWHLLLPQLAGVMALLAVLRFLWSFQNFNDIYLLTGGSGGTEVLAVRVYTELVVRANIGTASATGLLMTGMLLAVVAVYAWMIKREQA